MTIRFAIPISLRDLKELSDLRKQLKAGRYDCLVYLAKPKGGLRASIRDYLFFCSCGIRQVIGIPFSRNTLRCERISNFSLFTPEKSRTLESVKDLGRVDLNDSAWWDLRLTPTEITEADNLLGRAGITGRFIAGSVGTKVQANDWEERNWEALIRRLAASIRKCR